ncbi:MAG: glutamate racemase [Candidatus Omnitrophota bacterium]|nr:glutamate racemase [Candidatus Omnitrophota bacterium]
MMKATDFQTNRPIGIFDSGVGGLTVVRQVIKYLPGENIVYFGDLANLPYGSKSEEQIIRLSVAATKFLMRFNIKILVVGCNSSSAVALATLRRRFQLPIIGVIEPGVVEALKVTVNGHIGVIGTRATIISKAYQNMIHRLNPKIRVSVRSCPLFVPLVEEGMDKKITLDIVKNYLKPLRNKRIDALILGCTHYPMLKKEIARVIGNGITLIDSGNEVAVKIKNLLVQKEMLAPAGDFGKVKFYVSDLPRQFKKIGRRFLNQDIPRLLKVKLDV